MTRPILKGTLIGAFGILVAVGVQAQVPDPTQCTLTKPGGAVVASIPVTVFRPDGTPDPGDPTSLVGPTGPTRRVVTLRQANTAPCANCLVEISFDDCCDIVLCSPSNQTGVTADIVNHVVSGYSDSNGEFSFIVVGAGQNMEDGTAPIQDGCGVAVPTPSSRTVRVYATCPLGNRVLITQATGYVFNEDGRVFNSIASATDVYRCLCDILVFPAPARGRSDFNADGVLSGVDIFLSLKEINRLNLPGAQGTSICGSGGLIGTRVATCP